MGQVSSAMYAESLFFSIERIWLGHILAPIGITPSKGSFFLWGRPFSCVKRDLLPIPGTIQKHF
jgi:hypothetical protein